MTQLHFLTQLSVALPALHVVAAAIALLAGSERIRFYLSSAALGAASINAVLILALPAASSGSSFSAVFSLLIAFLGLIIIRFSDTYMRGEQRANWHAMLLHTALAAVATVAIADHLLLFLIGWVGISLVLNELLLFYPERPRAIIAAHKKFLFARLAELSLLCAFLLLAQQHQSWQLSEILTAYPAELSTREHIAASLIALAALIKCAQLPMHGWLMQVVEAPTPVSALLHAGIINLGGYLLIMTAPLFSSSEPAQWLVLVVAGLSMMIAALITATRVSIKVKLAWSTTAQMGMMLVECALGLYQLAMLHLVAHACYKGYLFLRSGSAVEYYLDAKHAGQRATVNRDWVFAIAIAIPLVVLVSNLVGSNGVLSPWLFLSAMAIAILTERGVSGTHQNRTEAVVIAVLMVGAYAAQKTVFASVANEFEVASLSQDLWVCSIAGLLWSGWRLMQREPQSATAKRWHSMLFAGLYLDEWVTRTTLKLWPPKVISGPMIATQANRYGTESK